MFGLATSRFKGLRPTGCLKRNTRRCSQVVGAVVAIGLLAFATPASAADEIEAFYKGKQVLFITGGAPGNDYDQWTRIIARHLGKHLPGQPVVVVQNMPGAGQLTAANHLYNIAEKDGSVIGMIGRNLPYLALTGNKNVKFDPIQFNWIGSPEVVQRVCAIRPDATVKRAEDLMQKEALMGGAGAGTAISNTPILLSRLLGFKFKLIEGYTSGPGVLLAIERKEIDGICITYSSLRSTRTGGAQWTFLFNLEHDPIEGVDFPPIYKFVKTDQQRRILTVYNSSVELGRPIVTPPGVPQPRVAMLRKAFEATLKDPQLRADAEKQNFEINFVSGETLENRVRELMTTPKEIVELVKKLANTN